MKNGCHFLLISVTFMSLFTFQRPALAASDLYKISLKTFEGKETDLSMYKGKVLLIVNTASKCGFTPQLKDLHDLQVRFESRGFSVLAFPSNDFKQDPESAQNIQKFMTETYKINFPVFDKISVTGPQKHPLYKYLTEQKPGLVFRDVSWNFEKFLVDRQGQVIERWNSLTKPSSQSVIDKIETALK